MPCESRTANSSATSKPNKRRPMRSKPKKEYEGGHGKPPVATRFKKGQSGNPNGRPPKRRSAEELNPGKILQSIDNEGIFVNINGKRKRMPKAEIYFQQLFT